VLVDNTGSGPLMVLMSDSLHVFNHEGNDLPGFPVKTRGGTPGSTTSILSDSSGAPFGCAINSNSAPEFYDFSGRRITGSLSYRFSNSPHISADSITGRIWSLTSAGGFLVTEASGKGWKNTLKSKLVGRGLISKACGADQPAFISESDSIIYLIDNDQSCRPAFAGSMDRVLCAERVDVDKDGQSEWLIGDERGIRLQTSDGWTLFRYPTNKPVNTVKAFRRKETMRILADDGGELYLLNASGHLETTSPIKSAHFRFRELDSGLDFEVLEGDSISIRALLR
jgi:hypothetical protein